MTSTALTIADIRAALAANRIVCCFQPIVAMRDRRVVGVEALARLDHVAEGILPPDMFIPQMEAAGLGAHLTRAVTMHAFQHLGAAFFEAEHLTLAVNLPLDLFVDPDMMASMAADCTDAGMAPGRMVIELTEGRPVSDLGELAAALNRWRDAGFQMAIDDAGPGTRNLCRLFELPFTTVKLDRSVVQGSADCPAARAGLLRTIESAKQHGLGVVAEGIEDAAAWRRMELMGVDEVQGFLVAEPLPAAQLPPWLRQWRRS